jgi:hypothetical protein
MEIKYHNNSSDHEASRFNNMNWVSNEHQPPSLKKSVNKEISFVKIELDDNYHKKSKELNPHTSPIFSRKAIFKI